MPTKTKKTVPVKNLRKAIRDGMSYKEAAKHALGELCPKLNICKDGGPKPYVEDVIKFMVETNDQSIKFQATKRLGGEPGDWCVGIASDINPGYGAIANVCCWKDKAIFYSAAFDVLYQADHGMSARDAKEDAKTLNQFVLDFYGIKRQAPTKRDARAKVRQIRFEITNNQKRIKALQAELKKFAKIP